MKYGMQASSLRSISRVIRVGKRIQQHAVSEAISRALGAPCPRQHHAAISLRKTTIGLRPLARLIRVHRVPFAPFTLFQNGGPTVRALLAGCLFDPGGNCPDMPGRVHNPSGPVAPELVFWLDKD